MGKNRYEWALSYLTVCCGVGIIVPLDKDLKSNEVEYLLGHSEASAIIYSEEEEVKLEDCSFEGLRIPMNELKGCMEKGCPTLPDSLNI